MNAKRQEANRVRVKRFRERAKGKGCKRLDIRLSGEAYAVLLGYRTDQEHLGDTLSRLLVNLSDNEQEKVTGNGRTDCQAVTGTVTGNGDAIVTGNDKGGDWTVTGNDEAIVTGNKKEGDRIVTGNGEGIVTGNDKEGDLTVTGNEEEDNRSVTSNERIAITGNAKVTLRRHLQAMKIAGLSYQGIAERLNAEGVPTLSGRGKWRKGTVGNLLRSE